MFELVTPAVVVDARVDVEEDELFGAVVLEDDEVEDAVDAVVERAIDEVVG